MQKPLLLIATSLTLLLGALLTGCDRKEKENTSPVRTPASTEAPRPADTPAPAPPQTPELPPHQNGEGSQPDSAPDPADLAIGEKVYKSTCSICHKSGLNGAPRVGSKKDWEQRLAQGKEILYGRAINGYRGSKGSMPSRGSNPRLSEAEVKAAVDYIIVHSIPSWSLE